MNKHINKTSRILISQSVYDFRFTCMNREGHLLVSCYANYTESGYMEILKVLSEQLNVIHHEFDPTCTHGKFRVWIEC